MHRLYGMAALRRRWWAPLGWVAYAVCAAAWGMPSPALAGHTAALTRANGSGADKAAAQVGHAVRAWLDTSDGHEAVDLETVLGNPERARALQALAAADELTNAGRTAYEALDLDAAVQSLTAALARYERLAAYLDDVKKVADLLMLLGATQILRGEEKQGVRRLEQAVSIMPEVEPDPRVFNPAMRKIFNEQVTGAGPRPTGRVNITSSPSYAEVMIDGRFHGVSPVVVEGLAEGRHLMRLRRDGMRPWGKNIEVQVDQESRESALMRPDAQADAFDRLFDQVVRRLPRPGKGDGDPLADPGIARLGELCRADELLVVLVKLSGERVVVWAYLIDVSDSRLIRSVEHIFAYDSAPAVYAREVGLFMQKDLNIGQAAPVDVVTAQDARSGKKERPLAADDDVGLTHAGQARCLFNSNCENLKKAVVGATVGTGAVSAGLGLLFWKFSQNNHNAWKVTDQVNPESLQLEAKGKSWAVGGDVLMGLSVGLLVVGGLTWWLWEPQPSAGDVVDPAPRAARLRLSPTVGGLALGMDVRF